MPRFVPPPQAVYIITEHLFGLHPAMRENHPTSRWTQLPGARPYMVCACRQLAEINRRELDLERLQRTKIVEYYDFVRIYGEGPRAMISPDLVTPGDRQVIERWYAMYVGGPTRRFKYWDWRHARRSGELRLREAQLAFLELLPFQFYGLEVLPVQRDSEELLPEAKLAAPAQRNRARRYLEGP